VLLGAPEHVERLEPAVDGVTDLPVVAEKPHAVAVEAGVGRGLLRAHHVADGEVEQDRRGLAVDSGQADLAAAGQQCEEAVGQAWVSLPVRPPAERAEPLRLPVQELVEQSGYALVARGREDLGRHVGEVAGETVAVVAEVLAQLRA